MEKKKRRISTSSRGRNTGEDETPGLAVQCAWNLREERGRAGGRLGRRRKRKGRLGPVSEGIYKEKRDKLS